MRPGRIVALVLGCLFVLPGLAALAGGAVLGASYAFARDDDGFFEVTLDRLDSPTVAIAAEDIDFDVEPGTPGWLVDALDADVRLRAESATGRDVFVGIAPEQDLTRYLGGVAHDEVVRVDDGDEPVYRTRDGVADIAPPTDQTFWTVWSAGPGEQELLWEVTDGRWGAVVMNADGSPGIRADVAVGVRSDTVLPLALVLLGIGLVLTCGAVVLIVVGASGLRTAEPLEPARPVAEGFAVAAPPTSRTPVALRAVLDPQLSRWRWLVKWFLAIPHFVVLLFLWIAFVVVWAAAGVAILFTGRYPIRLFDFAVGVLRWTWRVSYYATTGGIGTDRYPPFSLGAEADYPATLDIERPGELSRGLVLVKWWLLAIPHYLVLSILLGGGPVPGGDSGVAAGLGLLGVLVLVAGGGLLFTGRYPRPLFDLVVGLNRWVFRVIAYSALMTDRYPPFRLDQGGDEPPAEPGPNQPSGGDATAKSTSRIPVGSAR